MDMHLPKLAIRDHFLGWQCRLRQKVMRQESGCPSMGMQPRITREDGSEMASAITVLIIEKNPEPMSDTFQHIARKTHDPRQRFQEGLRLLSSSYYQYPENFSDLMTALFSANSTLATTLIQEGQGVLHFHQYNQGYTIPCSIHKLEENNRVYRATYWHNHLFNPILAEVCILAFSPDWSEVKTIPSI